MREWENDLMIWFDRQLALFPDLPFVQGAGESLEMRLINDVLHMVNLPCQFRLPVVDDRERTEDKEGPTKSFTATQVHQQGDGLEWFETQHCDQL